MPPTDPTLLQKWADEQDPEAFKEIISRYAPMVYATCKRILADPVEAETVTRECFKLLVSRSGGPLVHVGAWLHAVAANLALEQARGDTRRQEREQRLARGTGARAEVEWRDIDYCIDPAIAELPPKFRIPVVAHFLEAQSQAAIAQVLATSRQKVSSRIRKALELIRKSLEKHGIEIDASSLGAMMGANLVEAVPVPTALMAELEELADAGPIDLSESQAALVARLPVATGGVALGKKAVVGAVVGLAVILGVIVVTQRSTVVPTMPGGRDTPALEDTAETTPISRTSAFPPQKGEVTQQQVKVESPPIDSLSIRKVLINREAGGIPSIERVVGGRVVRADTRRPITDFQIGFLQGALETSRAISLAEKADLSQVTNDAGRFRLAITGTGAVTVVAAAPGFVPAAHVLGAATPGETILDLEIPLEPGGAVAGKVVNAMGRPVPDAGIFITPFDLPPRIEDAVTRSRPDGSFQLAALPSATRMISAYHRDYAPGWTRVSPNPSRTAQVTITLYEGGVVEGRITAGGYPLGGHEVRVDYPLYDTFRAIRTVTRSDGSYLIARLPEGQPRVSTQVTESGHQLDQLAIIENGKVTVVDFDFGEDAAIEGTVLVDGQPLANADVNIMVLTKDGAAQELHSYTDASGYYTLESIPAGTVTLKVTREFPDGTWKDVVRTFEAVGGELTSHDINISSGGGALSCRIRGARSDEIFYTAVLRGEVAIAEPSVETLYQVATFKVAEPKVREDGTFRLDGLEPGTYTVLVFAADPRVEWTSEQEMLANARFDTAVVEVTEDQEVSADLALR